MARIRNDIKDGETHPIVDEIPTLQKVPVEEVKYSEEELKLDLKDLYVANSPYSPEQKISAVNAYLITGTSTEAEKFCGIKSEIIRQWKNRSTWWPELLKKQRDEKNEELDAQFTNVLHAAVGEIADRVTNGDEVIAKDGSIVRKKINGRDLATILGILYDKRALSRGDVTGRVESKSASDNLKVLEKKMTEFAKKLDQKTIEGETTRIEDIEPQSEE